MNFKIDQNPADNVSIAPLGKAHSNGVDGNFASVLRHTEIQQSDTVAELEKYLKMSPGERVAAAMRKQLGISEGEYAAMSPEQKKAVDVKVADLIKEKMNEEMQKQQAAAAGLKSGISL